MIQVKAIKIEWINGRSLQQVFSGIAFVLLAFMTAFLFSSPSVQTPPETELNAWNNQAQDRTALALNFHEVQQLCRLPQKTPVHKASDDPSVLPGFTPNHLSFTRQAFVSLVMGLPQAHYLEADRIRDPPESLLLV